MLKAGAQFFGNPELLSRLLSNQVIPFSTIAKMSEQETKGYANYIEQNLTPEQMQQTPAQTNLANFRSAINGLRQSSARAYAPAGFGQKSP